MTYDGAQARVRRGPVTAVLVLAALLLAAWLWSFRAGRRAHTAIPQPGEVVPGAPPPATSDVPNRGAPAGASPRPGATAPPPR